MSDEKKIIIDEDWKSRVQAEKEQAAKGEPPATPDVGKQASDDGADVPMPPASLEMLLTTLATEALVALGEMLHPATGKVHFHPNQAQYLIDTIEMLQQKTKGNLTAVEEQMMDSLLHQLRMIFVSKANRPSQKSAST